MNIPLISKKKQEELREELPDDPEVTEFERRDAEESGYRRGLRDADEEGIDANALPDDAKYQFWGSNVFGQNNLESAPLSRLILPSLATSYHQKEITIAAEIRPFLARILYMQMDILQVWSERYEKNKERYWEKGVPERGYRNIFRELRNLTDFKLDADNKTRLSYEMAGLREVNTMRKDIGREERVKKADEKLGVRI